MKLDLVTSFIYWGKKMGANAVRYGILGLSEEEVLRVQIQGEHMMLFPPVEYNI